MELIEATTGHSGITLMYKVYNFHSGEFYHFRDYKSGDRLIKGEKVSGEGKEEGIEPILCKRGGNNSNECKLFTPLPLGFF